MEHLISCQTKTNFPSNFRRQMFLTEILLLGKPLCFYATHSSNYYQRPQINRAIELMSPLSTNRLVNVGAAGPSAPIEPVLPFNSNDRYKRHVD